MFLHFNEQFGIIWASLAARMGYKWHVGNGQKIRFWEDHCFDSSILAIQFWDLYVLVHEKPATIADAWDGVDLKFTFRRCVL